jgi:hypothetical protein
MDKSGRGIANGGVTKLHAVGGEKVSQGGGAIETKEDNHSGAGQFVMPELAYHAAFATERF